MKPDILGVGPLIGASLLVVAGHLKHQLDEAIEHAAEHPGPTVTCVDVLAGESARREPERIDATLAALGRSKYSHRFLVSEVAPIVASEHQRPESCRAELVSAQPSRAASAAELERCVLGQSYLSEVTLVARVRVDLRLTDEATVYDELGRIAYRNGAYIVPGHYCGVPPAALPDASR